jgi:DNA-directed RNA polymerase subunit RPC12/RpoP
MATTGRRGGAGAPLVAGTGQAWKVTAGIGAMVVAAVGSVVQFLGPGELRGQVIAVAIAAGLAGIAVLLWVRCPRCGRSLGAWAFQTGSLTTWHEALVEASACPYCGHRAGDATPGRR